MEPIRIAIDRGGTFTDVYAVYEGKVYTAKVLSQSEAYEDANSRAMAAILEQIDGVRPKRIDVSRFAFIRLATTVATNALLERKGARVALVTHRGFGDLFFIKDQRREGLFSVGEDADAPEPIVREVIEAAGRCRIDVEGKVVVEEALDEAALADAVAECDAESFAVVRLHAYAEGKEEKRIADSVRIQRPGAHVSLSCEVAPVISYLERGLTTLVDAYLSPVISRYISRIVAQLEGDYREKLYFMQSDGGLCKAEAFRGANALLSGPAGGVTALRSLYERLHTPLIGFDMGGTSTDVSRMAGRVEMRYRDRVAGIDIAAPSIAIHTVAAGGGSRLFYRHGLFEVGPESAGSMPGPVCYGREGYLSVTDANVLTGRVDTEAFEPLFGPAYDAPLYVDAAYEAMAAVAKEAGVGTEACAEAFLTVADEVMANAIKEITLKKGIDASTHTLVAFGGAGGQHAVGVARKLGISRIFVPRYASIFSAVGLMDADETRSRLITLDVPLENADIDALVAEVPKAPDEEAEVTLLMRFERSDTVLDVPYEGDVREAFEAKHRRLFGFNPEAKVRVDAVRITLVRRGRHAVTPPLPDTEVRTRPHRIFLRGGWVDAKVYETLAPHLRIPGPALVRLQGSTLLLDEASEATVDAQGNLDVTLHPLEDVRTELPEAARLALYANRFAFIARKMGERFKRTAVSLNIKEREDFSCAVFDREGNLVVNAPHIPVHLGAMSEAVKQLLADEEIDPDAVYLLNAPYQGGSHLPDLTVITPYGDARGVRFFVASRGHHADIGGKVPGSMPADSVRLDEEGAVIERMKVVKKGVFRETMLRKLLEAAGARRIEENLSDIQAAISANRGGIDDLAALLYDDEPAFDTFTARIQELSETAMRRWLKGYAHQRLRGEDRLDSGARIVLEVRIDETGGAVFDFSQSDAQIWGNQNTPYAVLKSAVLYALRLMLQEDLPLNEGLMRPVKIVTKEGTLLHPDRQAAVVGGNVTTSQRIVDVVLHTFGFAANAQGCMNNITFGNAQFGYYETVGGGEGAWRQGNGRSGVHVHMTNTKITDVEILERRYPIRIERFAYRKDSGGEGTFHGGDGLVRAYRFDEPMEISLLTERRALAPRGLAGGKKGARGRNTLIKADGTRYTLPPKAHVHVEAGDRLIIETPGGGGYGKKD